MGETDLHPMGMPSMYAAQVTMVSSHGLSEFKYSRFTGCAGDAA